VLYFNNRLFAQHQAKQSRAPILEGGGDRGEEGKKMDERTTKERKIREPKKLRVNAHQLMYNHVQAKQLISQSERQENVKWNELRVRVEEEMQHASGTEKTFAKREGERERQMNSCKAQ
jgi:hypothetical protein